MSLTSRIRPLGDRILCVKEPLLSSLVVLTAKGEKQRRTSAERLRVYKVGPDVEEVEVNDVIYIANTKFTNIVRGRLDEGKEFFLFHESDVDAVELGENL